MLSIRSWQKWQGEALYDRIRKRAPSGRAKPVTLAYVAVATDLDDPSGNLAAFAEQVGGGIAARGYLVMILGYVGRHDATTGAIRVSRDLFGPLVLSDRTVQTPPNRGAKVYDALIASGIAEEIADGSAREISPPPSREASREASPPPSREGVSHARGHAPERAGDHARMSCARVYAQAHERVAPAASPVNGSSREASPAPGGRRGEERRGESSLPTSPAGEGLVASPAAPAGPTLADCRNVLRRIVSSIRAEDADELRDAVERAIRGAGWEVERGPVGEPLANGRPGTIDLVVTWPQRIGIELDRKSPREKSLERLRSFDGHRVVVLRERPDEEIRIDGIEILVAGHSMPRAVTTCPRHGRIVTPEAPCSVCATLDTAPADPAVAAAALAEIKAKLARPKRVVEAKPAASPPPTLDPAERERIRATMGEESAA